MSHVILFGVKNIYATRGFRGTLVLFGPTVDGSRI